MNNTTEPLTQALTAQGWTPTGEHPAAMPGARSRELTSRDGLLTAWVSAVPGGCSILLTAKTVQRPDLRRRGWQAQLDALPLPVVLAAIAAASEEPTASWPTRAERLLTDAGWHEQPAEDDEFDDEDEDEQVVFEFHDSLDDAFLYRAWATPDSTRQVQWFGPDDDPAHWSIRRAAGERSHHTHLTHYAPAAVIAALALTD
jgi:hypothetical protein